MKGSHFLMAVTAAILLPCLSPAQFSQKAEDLVRQIRETADPVFDASRSGDEEYRKGHTASLRAAIKKRRPLVISLFRESPEHPAIKEFLAQRWSDLDLLGETPEERRDLYAQAIQETDALMVRPDNYPSAAIWPEEDWKQLILFWRSKLTISLNEGNWPAMLKAVNDYISEVTGWPETHTELILFAAFKAPTPQNAAEGYRLMLKVRANDPLAPIIEGKLRRIESIGQPVEFAATDLATKKKVSTASWKNVPVVVEFFSLKQSDLAQRAADCSSLLKAKPNSFKPLWICVDSVSEKELKEHEAKLSAWVKKAEITWTVASAGATAQKDFLNKWDAPGRSCTFILDSKGVLLKAGPRLNLQTEISRASAP